MPDRIKNQRIVDEALRSATPERFVEGAVLTNWVVICEWASPDGDRWLTYLHPEESTTWHAKGMTMEFLTGRLGWIDQDED